MPDTNFPTAGQAPAAFPNTGVSTSAPEATDEGPMDFARIYHLHQKVRATLPEFAGSSLEDFSKAMNSMTGTENYSAGIKNSIIKRASVNIDDALNQTGVPQTLGDVFGGVGSLISPQGEQTGRKIGEGFLRGGVDSALVLGGMATTVATGGLGAEVGIPMMAIGGADTFAKTLTDTGSPAAALVDTAATFALPKFMSAGAKALSPLKSSLYPEIANFIGPVSKVADERIGSRFIDFIGMNMGAAANTELARQASSVVQGQGLQPVFTPEHAFETAAGLLPFVPYQLHEIGTGARAAAAANAKIAAHITDMANVNSAVRAFTGTLQMGTPKVKDETIPPLNPQSTTTASGAVSLNPTDLSSFHYVPTGEDLDMATALSQASAKPSETLMGKPLIQPELAKTVGPSLISDSQPPAANTRPQAVAPVEFAHIDRMGENFGRGQMPMFNLTEDVAGLGKKGSTISLDTLTKKGFDLPPELKASVDDRYPFSPMAKYSDHMSDSEQYAHLELAKEMVEKTITSKNDLEGVAKLSNEIAGQLELPHQPVMITDEVLQKKLAENMSVGLNPQEATERTAQAAQNRLNKNAGDLSAQMTRKQKSMQKEQEAFNTLPEPAMTLAAKVMDKLSRASGHEMDTDISHAWNQVANKFFDKPENVDLLSKNPIEAEVKLTKEMQKAKQYKALERTRDKTTTAAGAAELKNESNDEPVKSVEIEHTNGKDLSETGHTVMADMVKHEDNLVRDIPEVGGDISGPEARAARGKDVDSGYVQRLNALMREFMNGNILRVVSKGGWKFQFNDINALKPEFGDVAKKTIMDFVKDNHPVLGKILADRMSKTMGQDVKFMTWQDKRHNQSVILDDKILAQPGSEHALPISARAFFQEHFMEKGQTPAEANRLADMAVQVAAAYKEIDRTRVTQLIDEASKNNGIAGVALTAGKEGSLNNGIIGLNTLAALFKNAPKEFVNYLKLHILGHEMWHRMEDAYTRGALPDRKTKAMENMFNFAQNMPAEDRESMLFDLFHLTIPHKFSSDKAVADHLYRLMKNGANDPSEFLATLSGLFTLTGAEGHKPGAAAELVDYLVMSDKQVADFANLHYLDLLDTTGALHDFMVASSNPTQAKLFTQFQEGFKALLSNKAEIDATVSRIRYFQNFMEGGYQTLVELNRLKPIQVFGMDAPPQMSRLDVTDGLKSNFSDPEIREIGASWLKTVGLKDDPGKPFGIEPNWYQRVLMPPAQLAEQFPITKPIVDLMYKWKNISQKFQTMALAPFMVPDKKGNLVVDPTHSGISRILNEPKLNETISKIFLEQNARDAQILPDDEITRIATADGHSGGDIDLIHQTVKNTAQTMKAMGEAVLGTKLKQMGIVAARSMLNAVPELGADKAVQFSHVLSQSVLDMLSGDPVKQQTAQQQIAQITQLAKPEGIAAAMQMIQGLLPKYLKLQDQIQSRPGYTPEARLGRYYMRYTENKQSQSYGFDTREELEAAVKKAQATADPDSIKVWDKFERGQHSNQLYGSMAQAFTDFEQAALESAKAISPEDKNLLDKLGYHPGEATFREIQARGFGKYLLKRKLVGGREELNMMEGVLDYVSGMSNGLAKSYTRDMAGLYSADPTLKANPKIKNMLGDYVNVNLDPPAKEWNFLKNAVFQFTMGGNLSSLLVERMQPLFNLVPHLTQNGSGIAGSYNYMFKAMKELTKVASGKDANPVIVDALKKAHLDGTLDNGVYQQLIDDKDVQIANLRNLALGSNETLSKTQMALKPLQMYTDFTRNLYSKTAAHNGKIGFTSGLLLALDKGMSPEQAYDFAVRTTRITQGGGGNASRPIGLFANSGKFYPAVGAWYALKHYTTTTMGMLYRLGYDSFSKQGVSGAEVIASRKAFGQMMMTQFLMTGAMGLPLLGGALSVAEQIDPNLQVKKALREGLASLAGDDKEMGELISDSFLHGGLARVIPGLSNVDISARLGLGDAFGIDPNLGVTAQSLLGAPGSLMNNILNTTGNLAKGKYGEAVEDAVPNSWRNMIRAYNDDYQIRDSQGRLLLQPTDTENILQAVGLRPKRLSELREEQGLLQRSNDIEKRQLVQFHQQLADVLLSGDTATVKSLLMQKHAEDSFYDPRAGLRLVVQAAQDKTLPEEPRDRGPRGNMLEREALSSSFKSRPLVSELELLNRRKQAERSVGLAGAGVVSPTELRMAQMVDQLRASNPTLSREHAQALVSRQLAPNPLYK